MKTQRQYDIHPQKRQYEIKWKSKDEIIVDKNQTWHNTNEIPKMVEH